MVVIITNKFLNIKIDDAKSFFKITYNSYLTSL